MTKLFSCPLSTDTKRLFSPIIQLLCRFFVFSVYVKYRFWENCRFIPKMQLKFHKNICTLLIFRQKPCPFLPFFTDCSDKNTYISHDKSVFRVYFFKIRNPMKFDSFYFFNFYFSPKNAVFSTLKKFLPKKFSLKYFLSTCIFPFFIIK